MYFSNLNLEECKNVLGFTCGKSYITDGSLVLRRKDDSDVHVQGVPKKTTFLKKKTNNVFNFCRGIMKRVSFEKATLIYMFLYSPNSHINRERRLSRLETRMFLPL